MAKFGYDLGSGVGVGVVDAMPKVIEAIKPIQQLAQSTSNIYQGRASVVQNVYPSPTMSTGDLANESISGLIKFLGEFGGVY
jgi:hypothetical protein